MGRAGTFVVMAEVPAFLYPLCPPKGEAAAERQSLQALLRLKAHRFIHKYDASKEWLSSRSAAHSW
jgi:hypothetical protein